MEPVSVPVYSLPPNSAPPTPRPLTYQSFRSPLPFRIYRAPPPIKPSLLPQSILKKISNQSNIATSPKIQPVVASHDVVQPIIEWDSPEEAG